MGKSLTPAITSTETGGGTTIRYGLNPGVSQTPQNLTAKTGVNFTVEYTPSG